MLSEFLLDQCQPLLSSQTEEAHIIKSAILIDVGDRKLQGPQTPHCDTLLDGNGKENPRRGVIAPGMAGVFSFLVYDKSHSLLWRAALHHKWNERWGFKLSTKELDQQFSESVPLQEPMRLWVDRGQMVIFDGHLVHAGDESRVLSTGDVHPNIRWDTMHFCNALLQHVHGLWVGS